MVFFDILWPYNISAPPLQFRETPVMYVFSARNIAA